MPWLRSMFLLLLASTVAAAGDWPQWLGPNRDATTTEKIAPWKEAPKVLWRQPVGEGHSSPVVAAGKVFVHARVKDKDEEEVIALDARSGKEVWRASHGRARFTSLFGNGPRATPAVVGDKVYTFGVTGILTCWEAATGKQVWQVDTLKQFAAKNLTFGVSCSPIVVGDNVLVNVGGKGASIVAFNKDSGKVTWKNLDDPASYSSPITIGRPAAQVLFLTQQGVVSLDPQKGEAHWKFPLVDKLSESSTTPLLAGDLVVASSVTYGSVAFVSAKGPKAATPGQRWKNPNLTCYFSTPVLVGEDNIYMVTGTPSPWPQATLRCVEVRSGKELWHKEKIGKYHAALLRTGGDKLLLLDDAGSLALLDPNPKEYRELARAKVCGEAWAHPALADGRLYVRDGKELICLQLGEVGNP